MLLEENEDSYVYKSRRKNISLKRAPKGDSYYHRIGDRLSQPKSSQSDRKTKEETQQNNNLISQKLEASKARVNSFKTGYTHYGFPSTLKQGIKTKTIGDLDPQIENENLITKQDFLQSSIKSLRKEMKEQGNSGGPEQFADKRDGVFGGLKRVFDGFVIQNANFQAIPSEVRQEQKIKRDQILNSNRRGAKKI